MVERRRLPVRRRDGTHPDPETHRRRAPRARPQRPALRPPHRLAQLELVDRLDAFGRDRFAIFDLENEEGTPIYVHAKTVVVDDTWAAVGSDNLNRRSWTHDSELSCAILDGDRDLRELADPAGLGDGARASRAICA